MLNHRALPSLNSAYPDPSSSFTHSCRSFNHNNTKFQRVQQLPDSRKGLGGRRMRTETQQVPGPLLTQKTRLDPGHVPNLPKGGRLRNFLFT
ncbi:unnamed protein product [Prunus armeniaca]|uniref:Uncharacterized protein n=1 Tax=Prunus armeniaca TaxID=36596 RepID=A0A6J5XLG7_PRUAR|nr:unnamed protein product [Prunus armeniaca]CAB4313243.1 unnamed protein product [Prunus armeniaca]